MYMYLYQMREGGGEGGGEGGEWEEEGRRMGGEREEILYLINLRIKPEWADNEYFTFIDTIKINLTIFKYL